METKGVMLMRSTCIVVRINVIVGARSPQWVMQDGRDGSV